MLIKVRVTAGAKRESVSKRGKAFILSVKEKAERNQANLRARELVAREVGVPVSRVRLISGHHTPSKLFEVKEYSEK